MYMPFDNANQVRKARQLAISILGAKEVSEMKDCDVQEWISQNYHVYCSIDDEKYRPDGKRFQTIMLIPNDKFTAIEQNFLIFKSEE